MTKQDIWTALIKNEYLRMTGSIPSINPGTDPARDFAIVQHVGPSRQYWLTYPLLKYDADYWNIFLAMFSDDKTDIHLSTALVLSEQILGDRVFGLSVPDVWVLSVEVLHQDVTSKTL